MVAVVFEPGMPSANVGTMAPADEALFADSGPATASIAPCPNFSGCSETRFSNAYDKNDAIVAPAPGNTPMKNPSTLPRRIAQREAIQSA